MSVIRNISFFLVAMVFAKGVGFLQSFVLAKALGPTNFGLWVTVLLIAAYSPIICLGTVETMLKEVPYYLGRSDLQRVHEVESGVLGSIVLAALILVAIGLTSLLVLPSNFLGIGPLLLFLVFITIAISTFTAYFYWRFAAYENFKAVAALDVSRSILAFLFIGGMAWIWGLRGAVVGYLLHEAGVCLPAIWLNVRAHGPASVSFRADSILHAIRVGFPITLVWWVLTLQASVDRVVLGSLSGALAVGYYGLGISLTSVLGLVPSVVGRVLYPKVNRRCGEEADADSMKSIVLAPTLALGAMLANLQLMVLISMPFIYNHLLPKYQPGLRAAEILLLGSFFVCLLRNGVNYLIATHKERRFLKYLCVTLVFNIVADVSLVKAGWGLQGVAIGTSLAGLLLSTLVWRRVLIDLGCAQSEVWFKLLGLYLPVAILSGAVLCIGLVYGHFLREYNAVSIALGMALLIGLNGLLFLSPIYRAELPEWRRLLLRVVRPIWKPLPVAEVLP